MNIIEAGPLGIFSASTSNNCQIADIASKRKEANNSFGAELLQLSRFIAGSQRTRITMQATVTHATFTISGVLIMQPLQLCDEQFE